MDTIKQIVENESVKDWGTFGIHAAIAAVVVFVLLKVERKIAGKWLKKYDGINSRFTDRVIRAEILALAGDAEVMDFLRRTAQGLLRVAGTLREAEKPETETEEEAP